MSKQKIHNLKNCYSSMSDEKLKKIVETDFADYLPEAINLAELELKERGVKFTYSNPRDNASPTDDVTPRKTTTKILLRAFFIPVWLMFCVVLLGWFGMIRPQIKEALIWFLRDVCGVSSIAKLASIQGYGEAFFWFLIVLAFYKSFRVMMAMTR